MKNYTIFYSWQSDLRDSKRFIQSVLDKLEKKLKNNDEFCVTIDRDTVGVPGSPNIPATIWGKIEAADIFVADLSIINSKDKDSRKTPNPNVLLETGYAIRALGWDRVVLLYNEDYGTNDDEPFDLKQHRLTGFSLKDDEAKEKGRKRIISNLTDNLKLLEGREKSVKQDKRQLLTSLLMRAVAKAWEYYEDAFLQDYALGRVELVAISEAQLNLLDEVRHTISEDDYFEFHQLLYNLKMATTGSEDMGGHEYVDVIVKKYIEPLYCEYYEKIQKLPLNDILTEKFVRLFNRLAPEEQQLTYHAERFAGDKLVMRITENLDEVYAANGELLYKAKLDELGRITGYQTGYEYSGEYVEGRREGQGEEYFRGMDGFGCQGLSGEKECYGTVKRKGIWKADKLVEGTIYGVVLYKEEDGSFSAVSGYDSEEFTFMDEERTRFMVFEDRIEDCKNYYVGNITLKDGDDELEDASVRPLCSEIGGVRDFYCRECQ